MTEVQKIGIDDIAEAATGGVLRAMEARKINAGEFTGRNGFQVNINITAGGWPIPEALNALNQARSE